LEIIVYSKSSSPRIILASNIGRTLRMMKFLSTTKPEAERVRGACQASRRPETKRENPAEETRVVATFCRFVSSPRPVLSLC